MRGWIRGNWRHLMVGLLCAAIVISGTALYLTYRQPEVCSLCGSWKSGALSGAGDPQYRNRLEQ